MKSIKIGHVSILWHDCDVEYVPMESGFVVSIPHGDSGDDKQYPITRDTVRKWAHDGRLLNLDDDAYLSIETMNDILTDAYQHHNQNDRGKEEGEIYDTIQKSVKESETKAPLTLFADDEWDAEAFGNFGDAAAL